MSVIKIFVCYSHVDKVWVESEQPQGLVPWLERQLKRHKVEIWWDNGIHGGDDFKKLIFEKIDEAHIAILLFSNNMAGSDFILDIELPRIRERYEEKKLTILPILISPLSDLTRELLDWVLDIQMVPSNSKGLNSSVGTSEWPEIQTSVLNELYRRVNQIRMSESAQIAPPSPEREVREERNPGLVSADSVVVVDPTPAAGHRLPQSTDDEEPPLPLTEPSRFSKFARKSDKVKRVLMYVIPALILSVLIVVGYLISKSGKALPSVEKAKTVSARVAIEGKSFQNTEDIEMIWVKPGTFLMGSPEDEPERNEDETQHKVTLTQGYWLAKTEVTQGQWKSVMGNNPSHNTSSGLKAPVENISWEEAMDYCQRLTYTERERGSIPSGWEYSLPTEAQWEYACRAGTQGAYALPLDEVAWYDENSGDRTHEVGTKRANGWGFHDMHGNVWEWCRDAMDSGADYCDADATDPLGKFGSLRVSRGGGFSSTARSCRSAYRVASPPSNRNDNLGFRPALVPP